MRYLFAGIFFGFVLIKSEVVSWFRIQEMFRFDSIHMYGVLGSAIAIGALSVWIINRFELKDADGNEMKVKSKDNSLNKRYVLGGLIFGLGWALTGACPGPLYVLSGSGLLIMLVPLVSAIVGAWVYGYLRPKLPH
ncbi:YeeE/YedE family protein [Aliifodinibius sp. S!AR15-10]|uniref:DUF6691 family protein n=1 Tax=Aliifodinibius sp. S!AR15-10 TaxID=2950437 RepID=UPI00285923E8|nr:DUF6691 family protein [Aliifodinibius sp. S!AR15-10]MDR8391673.1 YeeE/YedE family protein [Aliifodinibius sp. S!AR15-10]